MLASMAHEDHAQHLRTGPDAADAGAANQLDEQCQQLCAVHETTLSAMVNVGDPWRHGQSMYMPTGEFWRAAFLEHDAPPPRS